jgi:hypothetical protein
VGNFPPLFAISSHFYPVLLNLFSNKIYYYLYYKVKLLHSKGNLTEKREANKMGKTLFTCLFDRGLTSRYIKYSSKIKHNMQKYPNQNGGMH